MIKLSTYVPSISGNKVLTVSSKHTKSVILSISSVIQHNKRDSLTNTTTERPALYSMSRRALSAYQCKKSLETDTLKRDCMCELSMSDTLDVVMVQVHRRNTHSLDFLRRVKENAEKRRAAKANGTTVDLKRRPVMPRGERVVKPSEDGVETLRPIPYDTRI